MPVKELLNKPILKGTYKVTYGKMIGCFVGVILIDKLLASDVRIVSMAMGSITGAYSFAYIEKALLKKKEKLEEQ